ncbi:MAG: hypothetical protein KGJ55_02315 [Gammaproteobacteria bacterium]|nr:hypothetical protein [Gammaproteobacteria bacterium]
MNSFHSQARAGRHSGACGDDPAPVPRRFLAPRWWPIWLGLGLARALACLPTPWLLACGRGFGKLLYALLARRRRVVRINLRWCFPQMPERDRDHLARAHFQALGMGVAETFLAWFAADARLSRRVEFEGLEHLRAAQASGRGIMLLTGHFTTMELGCRLVHLAGCPFHGMYRPANNAFSDWWIRRCREARLGLPMVPKQDLRQVVRLLRRGAPVWYGPDQTLDVASSAFVPFFDVPTLTLTTTSRLAELGHALVLPYFCLRRDDRYRLVFLPPWTDCSGSDELIDARRINAFLEAAIERAPEQYFWVHRRFKDLPPGVEPPY